MRNEAASEFGRTEICWKYSMPMESNEEGLLYPLIRVKQHGILSRNRIKIVQIPKIEE